MRSKPPRPSSSPRPADQTAWARELPPPPSGEEKVARASSHLPFSSFQPSPRLAAGSSS
ncbi:hypothetical protein CTA2_883 [Colletotrichum tanaceti]|uniref:Uncharacterized protein n=1 Tax=Colletotrichum tanaceti TaxID=1306861 RepID=A0A4U6X2L7_9PEZI|nr:hypothetical protein CTA2_883 [Colletotrichum tanaceti]TKW49395.1 hypothetical protein CTA1_10807 [Colletotrichum tanaceti]